MRLASPQKLLDLLASCAALDAPGAGCSWTAAGLQALRLHRPALPGGGEHGRPRTAYAAVASTRSIRLGSADQPRDHHETSRARHQAGTTRLDPRVRLELTRTHKPVGPTYLMGPLCHGRLGSSVRVPLLKHPLAQVPDGPTPQNRIVFLLRACRRHLQTPGPSSAPGGFATLPNRPARPTGSRPDRHTTYRRLGQLRIVLLEYSSAAQQRPEASESPGCHIVTSGRGPQHPSRLCSPATEQPSRPRPARIPHDAPAARGAPVVQPCAFDTVS
jgi:hypothetical protein